MDVLIIEDDDETADFIGRGLSEYGHVSERARDGRDGLFVASEARHDVLVVDRMLPCLDGLSLVRLLRQNGVGTPTLFLTALGDIEQKVEGLNAGGDDYLVKPFAFSELYARLMALHRRREGHGEPTILEVGDLQLNRLTHEVTRRGQRIQLQSREFRLLSYLMAHSGEVVTRTMLLEKVWDYHFEPRSTVVETHISRLRAKIDKPFDDDLIRTVRGAGYVIGAAA